MRKLKLELGSIREMLTKEQLKKVAGGYDDGSTYDEGRCSPGVGRWAYTTPVNWDKCAADIATYCSSGEGGCHVTGTAPWPNP